MAQGQTVWKFPLKSVILVIIFVRARTPKASPVQVPFSSSQHLICPFLNICVGLYAFSVAFLEHGLILDSLNPF